MEVGQALVSEFELDRILRRVLDAAVEVIGARYAALGVLDPSREGLERFVHLGVDDATRELIGDLPEGRGVLGLLISDPTPLRLADVTQHPDSYGFPEGHPPMRTFLGVPITIGSRQWGNLYLTEKHGGEEFGESDERVATALAEWAAVAIGNARSVATERLRFAMDAAEQERLQWARELHDETLQGLAAIRLLLATGRQGDPEGLRSAVDASIEQIDDEIASMRGLISDLRPDSLSELGIVNALQGLAERMRPRAPDVRIDVTPADPAPAPGRLPAAIEVALYRVAQEAITNAIRHGQAGAITIALHRDAGRTAVSIHDDGSGFDPDEVDLGYGLIGMRERAELAGGKLLIDSTPGEGTTVRLRIPLDTY